MLWNIELIYLVKLLLAFCCIHGYHRGKQRRKVWLSIFLAGPYAIIPKNKGEKMPEVRDQGEW